MLPGPRPQRAFNAVYLDGERQAAAAAAGSTAVVAGLPRGGYEPRYVPATMPAGTVAGHAGWQPASSRTEVRMSDPGQDTQAPAAAGPAPMSLFVVERRLPKISQQQLAVLLAALSGVAGRFSARGDGVRYLRSIFLARQERLLSLFAAEGPETVRAVNQASLVPFASIEPAVELPGPGLP